MKTLRLPIPPSVNAAYGNNRGKGRGRYKTATYKAWERQADGYMLSQRIRGPLTSGPANVTVRLPHFMRGDIDNRIKPLLDWMVSRELTLDDSTHQSVSAIRDSSLSIANVCEVDISGALP